MHSTYEIPESELGVFTMLPIKHQPEIRAMLQVIWLVDHTPHRMRSATWRDAVRAANALLREKGLKPSLTVKTLYRKRAAFHESGNDWAVLIDKRKAPEWEPLERKVLNKSKSALPPDFRDFLRGLAQRQNRSSEQAIEELYRMWKSGECIPGYGIWTAWFAQAFPYDPMPASAPIPDGWSRTNLRRHMPSQVDLAVARRGIAAGVEKLPTIIRTRQGLRPLEYVVFDDWRCDFMVFVPGVEQAVELHGILAEDVACATTLQYGVRPAIPRVDETKQGLKRIDTKSLAVDLLLRHGYPLDYQSHWIVENGTATITPDDALAIEEITNGHVKVHYTSMISGRVFGWPDRPVGNFRGKSWLESFFNLLHNACGNVAGQIGAHYEKRPRSIQARDAELKALVKAEQKLPAHLRESLHYRMPFPNLRDGNAALAFAFHFLNHREHHACEGFDEILKVRLTEHDPWRPVAELIEAGHDPDALRAMNPRPFIETPAERQKKLSRGVRFATIPLSAVPLLLADHREVVVESEGEINLGSSRNPCIYRDRRSPYLTVGRKFLAYRSTTNDAFCHLTDGRRYICSVSKSDAISMRDAEAASREIAEKAAQLKRTLKRVQAIDINAPQRLADLTHNMQLAERQVAQTTALAAPADGLRTDHEGELLESLAAMEGALASEAKRREDNATRIRGQRGDLEAIFGPAKGEMPEAGADEQEEAVAALDRMY